MKIFLPNKIEKLPGNNHIIIEIIYNWIMFEF